MHHSIVFAKVSIDTYAMVKQDVSEFLFSYAINSFLLMFHLLSLLVIYVEV